MFEKLKIKIGKVNFTALAILALVAVMGSVFLSPKISQARDESAGANCTGDRSTSSDGKRVCQLSHIELTTDVFIDGKSSNLVKVAPGDTVTLTVKVMLNSPADIKADTKVIGNGADEIYFNTGLNLSIGGFGATLVPQNTSGFCGMSGSGDRAYTRCKNDNNSRYINQVSCLKPYTGRKEVFSKVVTLA